MPPKPAAGERANASRVVRRTTRQTSAAATRRSDTPTGMPAPFFRHDDADPIVAIGTSCDPAKIRVRERNVTVHIRGGSGMSSILLRHTVWY